MKSSLFCQRLSVRYVAMFLTGIVGIAGLNMKAEAGSASGTFNFTATFVAPTCTMNVVPSLVDFSSGGALQTSSLTGGGVTYPGGVGITFSDCSSNGMTRPPKVEVTGRTVTLGGSDLYFADEATLATPADGFGVKLSVSGDSLFEDSSNIAVTSGDSGGGVIAAKTGTTFSGLNGHTLNLTAQLSCGSYDPCSDAPAHEAGAFQSTVTFQLAYD
ncbi:fimbrial protein [Escherichia coli]|uniref:fimbrial protein n=1 Tax=Escherichia coli TaxID=562 RepID=UPI0038B4E22C